LGATLLLVACYHPPPPENKTLCREPSGDWTKAGLLCAPVNPCLYAKISCRAGQSVCADTNSVASDGTICGPNLACNAGACVTSVWAQPLETGVESVYTSLNQGDLATAEGMLNNVWPARGHDPVMIDWPLTWTEDPYNDAYWRFMFYGLQYTPNLLWAYATSNRPEFLQRLTDILQSYCDYDGTRPTSTTTFDDAHTSAYRAMVLVNSYVKLRARGVLPSSLDAQMVTSISKLGAFLADAKHYEPTFNHGFNEAAALLLIADNFPDMAEAAGWRSTASQRLLDMLSVNVDGDGVDVENSPFYHYFVLEIVSQIARWASVHEPSIAPNYDAVYRQMIHPAAAFAQPDGWLPMLGATASTVVPKQDPANYLPMSNLDPGFAWVYTHGSSGTPLPGGVELFPISGLFIMRSAPPPRTYQTEQTFITFDSGIYRTNHSHLDALSITYYSHGAELLRDSGLFTYDLGADFDYFHGTRGHNTVMVDGLDQAQGAAQPLGSGQKGESSWAAGLSDLYAGVRHVRTVVLVTRGLAVVADSLVSDTTHVYDQLWHVIPSATATTVGTTAVANVAGTDKLVISEADPDGLTLTTQSGATSPMQGWYSDSYGVKGANVAVIFSRSAPTAMFATVIGSGPYATDKTTIADTVTAPNQRTLTVSSFAGTHRIKISDEGLPTESVEIQ
jgi:hypothetical protein